MKIKEFKAKYPFYKMGFLALNDKTDTEKLTNLTMNLSFDTKDHKIYQCFRIPDDSYNKLIDKLIEQGTVDVKVNHKATFHLELRNKTIKGVCLETHERVMIAQPLKFFLGI